MVQCCGMQANSVFIRTCTYVHVYSQGWWNLLRITELYSTEIPPAPDCMLWFQLHRGISVVLSRIHDTLHMSENKSVMFYTSGEFFHH